MTDPTERAAHWDVQHYYLCLAATVDPSGEVIILTRGCSPHSRFINARQQSLGHRPLLLAGRCSDSLPGGTRSSKIGTSLKLGDCAWWGLVQ